MQDKKFNEEGKYKGQWARFLGIKISEKQLLNDSFKQGWIEMDEILKNIYKKY